MDFRCPLCWMNLKQRKLSQAIVARMEIDCPHCRNRIRLNVHPAEVVIALIDFGIVVVLVALAYGYRSQGLALAALGAAMAGALALPLLQKTWLRNWPRYAPMLRAPDA